MNINKFIKFADKKIDFKKFIKFGITGGLNTAIDWLAFAFFREILKIDPKFAQVAAQALTICNSYIVNKHWTFKSSKKYNTAEIIKFLAVQGTSLGIGYLGQFVLHDNLAINEYISKAIISCVTIIVNYFGNKLFVFK